MSATETALRVFIVDDEPPARNRLRDLLNDCSEQLPLIITGEASNGQEALDKLIETPADVVLLDIRMPQMDGIELAQHLNKMPKPVLSKAEGPVLSKAEGPALGTTELAAVNRMKWPPVIIFTTAYGDSAIKAFELHAIDYLLKPIRLGRLFDALTRARNAVPVQTEVLRDLLPEPRKHLSIHERGRIHLIPIEQVLYLRAELKYITVRTAEHEYLLEESLSALEKEFAARFVRIHRNCLVAKEAIGGFEKGADEAESGWMVKLKGLDEVLAISRRQQHIVKEFS
ncbi:MAG: DNA-binding response regulator [Gallionellales bacterium RIFCSPLOWO2_02_FULL_57_47]|nr:MAG: DNA-binding response regulator [Gallionellales bacterium RIFCSPLOWO2_02_FULL_57_47]